MASFRMSISRFGVNILVIASLTASLTVVDTEVKEAVFYEISVFLREEVILLITSMATFLDYRCWDRLLKTMLISSSESTLFPVILDLILLVIDAKNPSCLNDLTSLFHYLLQNT